MNAYRGDTHHHEVKDISLEEALEYLRRRGDNFVFLEYKEEDDPSTIRDPATLCTPDFLVIPGTEQAFIGRKDTWNHLSIEPLLIPIPDTETDYWHIPDGFAHVNERVPNALLRIDHPADGRWTLDDVRDAVAGGGAHLGTQSCEQLDAVCGGPLGRVSHGRAASLCGVEHGHSRAQGH